MPPDTPPPSHNDNLANAFDGQAARFERAPVQTDPAALARLVAWADLPADAVVLDAGCGPGLVSAALAEAGCRVVGVDLSAEMIDRARVRCLPFGDRTRFARQSLYDPVAGAPFDASVSRYVLHHVADPAAFLARQVALVRPGGVVVLSDHTTDPDPDRAAWHRDREVDRDQTHTANLTAGAIADRFAAAGLVDVRLFEEPFTLDFDEWFDRGTPRRPKAEVRAELTGGASARGFAPVVERSGAITLSCWRVVVRGVVPAGA